MRQHAGITMERERPYVDDFDDIYRRRAPELLRLAYVLTGSREAAEDIVQDVFLRVSDRLATLDDPRPYLRRAVVNATRSRHRRLAVAQRHQTRPIDNLIDDHELTEFRDTLLRLPDRQRAAIVFRYQYQMTDVEIADGLRCRRATVRSLVKRGLASLRKELA